MSLFKLVVAVGVLSCGISSCKDKAVKVEDDSGAVEEETVIWVGPGVYYGLWFDNEVEFDDYHRHHHHHHHDHHGGGHHGGGHHGGGHHGGGHHGGGHHGGGHHGK